MISLPLTGASNTDTRWNGMRSNQWFARGLSTVAGLALIGCAKSPAVPSVDALASAIRSAGYACTSVRDSNEINEGAWRIACESTLLYLANLREDGTICVASFPYGDSVVPASIEKTEERCVPLGDT
jgi:hypothetical protein